MWRIKRKYLRIITFVGMLLFLYITRSLVSYADEQLERSQSNEGNILLRINTHKSPSEEGRPTPQRRSSDFKTLPKMKKNEQKDPGNMEVIEEARKEAQGGQNLRANLSDLYYVDDEIVKDFNVSYPPFVKDFKNEGPGEWGEQVKIENLNVKLHGFNEEASQLVSVHRHIRDNRFQACKDRKYREDLPMASVIICFHNEAWSVLLRSVHSVIDQSPPRLLKEIILVDDASTYDYLKSPLKVYMHKLGKVKIVRLKEQQGLIRARLAGNDVAEGPALIFLDSHIECFPGWIEPLLDRISTNQRIVPFPNIAYINPANLRTGTGPSVRSLGVFTWRMLTFDWGQLTEDSNDPSEPIRSPTMPGGLFAIDKAWFETIGTYDPGLLYWGAENMELSFKTWMCNGSIEVLPCSVVGHIFRKRNPIKWEKGGNPILNNVYRVAEVWMDEYRHLVYENTVVQSPTVDVSDRKRLRDSLNCHDFRWYMETVCPQCARKPLAVAGEYMRMDERGAISSQRGLMLCLKGSKVVFNFRWIKEICSWSLGEDKTLYLSNPKRCLTVHETGILSVRMCSGSDRQKWIVERSKFPHKS